MGAVIKTAYDAEAITPNIQNGSTYTFVLADKFNYVIMDTAATTTVTIPTNAAVPFPIGTVIVVLRKNATSCTISADTGVVLTGNGGSVSAGSCTIQTQFVSAALQKIGTNEWHVTGDISTVT